MAERRESGFYVMASLEPVDVGELEAWPLSVTIVPPWFQIPDKYNQEFIKRVQAVADDYPYIRPRGLEEDVHGVKPDRRVRRVGSPILGALSLRLSQIVTDYDSTSPIYQQKGPYVTYRRGQGVAFGERRHITNFQLAARDEAGQRSIVHDFPMGRS